ncbi:MAG: M56 family metallopeptidase [Flavobacteriaceae bacterium]
METFFTYFIKVSVLVSLFYLSYSLLLKKETFFGKNRWFLLLGLVSSLFIPLISITKTVWIEPQAVEIFQEPIYFTDFPEEMMVAEHFTTAEPQPQKTDIHWSHLVAGFYLLGTLFFLVKFILSSLSLYKILHKTPIQKQNGYKFIDGKNVKTPFSFFNYIAFDSSSFSREELQNIITHEKVHSKQKHSFDVLFSEIFSIVFWLNPFVWFYKKAIQQNLEFIADHKAIKTSENKVNYQKTLLKITLQPQGLALANPFFQPLIKKRIMMLNKNQSKNRNLWKYAFILPVLTVFVMLFQTQVVAQEKEQTTKEILYQGKPDLITADTLVWVKDFSKSYDEWTNQSTENNIYIAGATQENAPLVIINGKEQENTFYPKDLKIDIQGVGSYKKYTPKEAVEKFGEKGKNGAYVIEAEKFTITPVYKNTKEEVLGKNPLVIVNGKEIGNKDFLLSNDILSFETKGTVTHYDKESAVKKFGEKAKDGAIVFEGKDTKISFQSNEKEPYDKKTNQQKQDGLVGILKTLKVYGKDEKPLYIVNGKETSEEELNKMRLGKANIDVLDYKEAVKKYGQKAKHGAIIIQEKSITENGKELFDFLKSAKDYKQIDIYSRFGNLIYSLKSGEKLDEEKLKSLDDGTYFYTLDKSSGERTVGYIYKGDDTMSKRLQAIEAEEREEAELRAKIAEFTSRLGTQEERRKKAEIRARQAEERSNQRIEEMKKREKEAQENANLSDEEIQKRIRERLKMLEERRKTLEERKKAKYNQSEIDEIKIMIPSDASFTYKIDPYTTDNEIKKCVEILKSQNIIMKVSNLKRNKNGEIYKIKISLVEDSETGNNKRKAKSEATFERENETIPDIYIGRRDGNLIVSSDKQFQ